MPAAIAPMISATMMTIQTRWLMPDRMEIRGCAALPARGNGSCGGAGGATGAGGNDWRIAGPKVGRAPMLCGCGGYVVSRRDDVGARETADVRRTLLIDGLAAFIDGLDVCRTYAPLGPERWPGE